MFKRMSIMIVACAVVFGGIYGFHGFIAGMIKKGMAAGASKPQIVSATFATSAEWQPEIKAVGNVRAVKGVDLAAEVSGIVEEIKFESDEDVQEGTMILQLRYSEDKARLKSLEAAAKLAEITLERDKKLLEAQAASQATVDADTANLASAKAQVAAQRAVIEKKVILAPFSGRLGIKMVDEGQFLGAGTPVVTLQKLDPIYIDFYLPQQMLPKLMVGQRTIARNDAFPDIPFEGQITAINAKVEEATRNILVRATFNNPEKLLLPGMFATVSIETGAPEDKITLPQTAITYNPYGSTVYVIEETEDKETKKRILVAKQKFVTTGETRGDQVVVVSGIEEGEQIVTSGQIKLRNGSPVLVSNEVVPSDDENPQPEEE